MRSGVERQLMIIGEALNKLSKISPAAASRINNLSKIVGFRHVVVHGYDVVEDETVWGIVESHLPALSKELEAMLKERGSA